MASYNDPKVDNNFDPPRCGKNIVGRLKRSVIFPPLVFISEEEHFEGVGHDTQDQGAI